MPTFQRQAAVEGLKSIWKTKLGDASTTDRRVRPFLNNLI